MLLMLPERAPVSVIIPAYNAAKTIERALSSIAAQTLLPEEIIVVDDGSSDGTADVVTSAANASNKLKIVFFQQQNKGAGAARNLALEKASQPYVAFLDADDEWLPEKLQRSMDVMSEGRFDLVAHDYLDTTDHGDVHIDCRQRLESTDDPYLALYLKGYIPSISVITKRELVIRVGGFDESLRNAQDFDLWLKLLADPQMKFTLFGEALARYHHSGGSIMTHTDRRLACCKIIALRYLRALKDRGHPVYQSLWRRIFNIYAEAALAKPILAWKYFLLGAVAFWHVSANAPKSLADTTKRL